MTEVLYLYGFIGEQSPDPPADLKGIDHRPVETIAAEGCRAAVSRLPAEEYTEERLQERLGDLAWVGEKGVLHEKVVTWFVDREGIVPARLFTLYSSREALVAEARDRKTRIVELLDRFTRFREWNLKVTLEPDRMEARLAEQSDAIAELDRRIEAAGPGRRYLLEKQREELVAGETKQEATRNAERLLDEVSALAEEVRLIEVPPEAKEGKVAKVALNAALLVAQNVEKELRRHIDERAEELEDLGLHSTLSGPWAPYRFIADEPAPAPGRRGAR